MKKIAAIGFALLMVFAVFVPFAAANDGAQETKGYLYVDLACRSPQIGGEFSFAPAVVSATFTDGARVDKGFVDAYVKYMEAVKVVQFLPQGQVDLQVEPGTYVLAMQDGNGGQPEFILVTLNTGEKQVVQFLGHGITPATVEKQKDVITVTQATYGATRVVVDQEAYDEVVTDHEAYYEHTHDHATVEVPCTHFHAAVYRTGTPCSKYTPGHVHANQVGGTADNQNRFVYNGHVYEINNGNGGDEFLVFGTYQAAHYEHTHDHATVEVPCVHFHPACTHVVHHPAVTHVEGSVVDVKAEVQNVLDQGVQNFKFDNAQNPGGIFTTANVLMKVIADPAYGQVKNVHIVYTVNGGAPKTVDAQEYQTISLV